MSLEKVIRNIVIESLFENKQLADKIYFKTNKLNNEQKDLILSITNGDNYTKIISDILYNKPTITEKKLVEYYNILKNYNKNVFPIAGFNDINSVTNIGYLIMSLDYRQRIIKLIKQLPSIAIRNLKNDIRNERVLRDFQTYESKLDYFLANLSLLDNKPENIKQKIYNKLFKNNMDLDQLTDFVEEKNNLISDSEVTKEEIIQLANEDDDMQLLYNNKNVLVIEVSSAEAIKEIGCNSLWCFTYGDLRNN